MFRKVKPLSDEVSIVAWGGWSILFGDSVYTRFCWLAGISVFECLLTTTLYHPWLNTEFAVTFVIFFFLALLFFGRDKLIEVQWHAPPVHKGWVALHASALALFGATNFYLVSVATHGSGLERVALWGWYSLLGFLPATLGLALFGLPKLLRLVRSLGNTWSLAAACDILMISVRGLLFIAWRRPSSSLGHVIQVATFRGVATLLGLFYTGTITDPKDFTVGTKAFQIVVSGKCSGIEGLALMLSLSVGWLLFTRRELRFGRAMLLVPVSLALIWLLNLVRLASLIAIGDAGYPSVAAGGFHSQAGWILLCIVALSFLLAVNNVAWFRQSDAAAQTVQASAPQVGGNPLAETNVAAVYLLPFLAILAAGLVAIAASDGFEWLYALRLFAALAVFYAYRRAYRRMDWRFSWLGPLAGVAVFVLWIALDHYLGKETVGSPATDSGIVLTSIAEGLARLSGPQRAAWIAVRMLAAVVTVPLAEELAFRGYIARILMSLKVESVALRDLSPLAVLGSSLIFGLLHGRMWPAGVLAGLVFALVAKARGRLGEAVAAHATANLLLAVWVIARGDYSLW